MTLAIDADRYFSAVNYEPHEKQSLFHSSKARFRIPVCGRRFGKSLSAGHELGRNLWGERRIFWIVGPTYDLGEKEFRVLWDSLIVKQRLGQNKRVRKSYNKKQGDMFIELPWHTRIEVRSADRPDTLVGEGLDGVIMSEAAKHNPETWERFIRPALADKRGWGVFPTTPEGQNWLYKLWQLGRNPDFPEYESWRFPSWDNSVIYPGGRQDPEILLLERTTDRAWFNQEIGADFTAFVGKIYEEFTEDTHVRKVEYNPAWPNYIAFDWGFVNPLAAIEFQVSPQDDILIWREHYKSYQILEAHLRELYERHQPEGYHISCCFGDAADPEAVATVNAKFAPCLALPEAKTNWRQGIETVKRFLRQYQVGEDEHGAPIEEPKLFIDHSCVNTIREFGNYRAKSATVGRNPSSPREAPQNIDDHALDAIRYGLVHIFELGARHHLTEVAEASSPLLSNSQVEETFFQLTRDF